MTGLMSMVQNMNNMQENAQAAVPVVPNNGNPNGAHNMPATVPNPMLQRYPWLGPSTHMTNIRQRLDDMGTRLTRADMQYVGTTTPQVPAAPPVVMPTPALPAPVAPRPMVGTPAPVMPQIYNAGNVDSFMVR